MFTGCWGIASMSWFNRNGAQPTGHGNDGAAVGLHSRETLLRVLEHERARCDRNGRGFALVVFDLARVPGNGAAHQRLEGVLATRLRRTDACGCLDLERVAAILPDTELDPCLDRRQRCAPSHVGDTTRPHLRRLRLPDHVVDPRRPTRGFAAETSRPTRAKRQQHRATPPPRRPGAS